MGELMRALAASGFDYLPTGYEIPAREIRLKMSDVPVIERPPMPENHSQSQTDIRGQEGLR